MVSKPQRACLVVAALGLVLAACNSEQVRRDKDLKQTDAKMRALEDQLGSDPTVCVDYLALCVKAAGICVAAGSGADTEAMCADMARRCDANIDEYCETFRPDGSIFPQDGGGPQPDGNGHRSDARPGDPDLPGPVAQEFTFFGIGDSRSHQDEFGKVVKSMVTLDPDAIAVFNIGDLTASGSTSEWKNHMDEISANGAGRLRADATAFSSDHMRYIGAWGNHDDDTSGYESRWKQNLSGQGSDPYFSLTYKNTLFVVLDAVRNRADQRDWLREELPKHADKKWKIVMFHDPPYPCNEKGPFDWGDRWAREFEQHGVDLVLVAHSHTYERTCPMVKGKCVDSGGPVYINVGSAGVGGRAVVSDKSASSDGTSYKCSEILKESRGHWTFYCHFAVTESNIVQRCYDQTNTTSPRFTWTLNKGSQ